MLREFLFKNIFWYRNEIFLINIFSINIFLIFYEVDRHKHYG